MIVPTMRRKRVANINLGVQGVAWRLKQGPSPDGKNILLGDTTFSRMIVELHDELGVDYSYTSYSELCANLWRGNRLDVYKNCVNLGMDVNVPVRTPVAVDRNCRVERVDNDPRGMQRWGYRVIVKLDDAPIWLMYPHLGAHVAAAYGRSLGGGQVIGRVGTPEENGGWYPHARVQAMTAEGWNLFQKDPKSADGFCALADFERMKKFFPDPSPYIKLV